MNIISGPAIADHCDYNFGDQAGVIGQVYGAFMKNANEKNEELIMRHNYWVKRQKR